MLTIVPFILVATFTILNLFIGIIVGAMRRFSDADTAETLVAVDAAREQVAQDLHTEVRALRGEIVALRVLLERLRDRALPSGLP
jgi:voltage-gated sodium channel